MIHRRFGFFGSWADVAMFKVYNTFPVGFLVCKLYATKLKMASMLKKQSGFVSKTLRSKEERSQAIFN